LHPHVHCLVTGGGLDKQQQWRACRTSYLLPVAVVKALYKGKLLARLWTALNAHELTLPTGKRQSDLQRLFRKLNEKSWNVRIQERYPQGHGVMLYLSRYVKGGAITNRRIFSVDGEQVTFGYTDHRESQRKSMTLTTEHFIQRVLWHVPEPGPHTVRHYGLYAHQGRAKRARCRTQLGQAPEHTDIAPLDWARFMAQIGQGKIGKCSICGRALLRCEDVPRTKPSKNSIYKVSRPVQQCVQLDPAAPSRNTDTGPP